MGFLKKALKVAAAPMTGGASLMKGGKLKNLLLGKKDVGEPDSWIELDPSLKKATEEARAGQFEAGKGLRQALKGVEKVDEGTAAQEARRRIAETTGALGQQARDQEMRAREQVARRGLGRSSVGLSAILNAGESARDAATKAIGMKGSMTRGIMKDQRQRQIGQLGNITGSLGNILNSQGAQRTFSKGRKGTGRGGGLLKTGLAIGGGILGKKFGLGEQGSQMGSALGSGIANY